MKQVFKLFLVGVISGFVTNIFSIVFLNLRYHHYNNIFILNKIEFLVPGIIFSLSIFYVFKKILQKEIVGKKRFAFPILFFSYVIPQFLTVSLMDYIFPSIKIYGYDILLPGFLIGFLSAMFILYGLKILFEVKFRYMLIILLTACLTALLSFFMEEIDDELGWIILYRFEDLFTFTHIIWQGLMMVIVIRFIRSH